MFTNVLKHICVLRLVQVSVKDILTSRYLNFNVRKLRATFFLFFQWRIWNGGEMCFLHSSGMRHSYLLCIDITAYITWLERCGCSSGHCSRPWSAWVYLPPFQFCAWSFIFIYLSLLPQSSLLCKVRFPEVGALSYQTNKTSNHSRYSSRQHRSRQPPPSRPSSSLSSLSSSPHGAAAARPCHTSAVSIVTCTSQPTVAPTTWGQQDETMKGSFVTGVA